MNCWILLWKIVFILGVGLFALMAIWVTIGGWKDVKDLLHDLQASQNEDSSSNSDPQGK